MTDSQPLGVSVVIPTHNRSELLWMTLDALRDQTARQLLLEVIVVSDGSIDATGETVRHFSDLLPIKFLEQPQRGVSSARNRGLTEAISPLVLLLDDDIIPSPQLIEAHIRFHQEMPALEAALLGYVTWYPDLAVTPYMRWFGEYGALFGYSLLADGQEISPRYLYSCNVSFKTVFLREHGGFNEALTVLEDHELGYRLAQHGMRLTFQKRALGYHYQTFTFEESCKRLERYSGGLNAFLATDAGRALAKRRRSLSFRLTERAVRIAAPLLSPLMRIIDADMRMPNAIYRLFYWYYAAYLSFWSRADKWLLRGR